MLTTVSIGNNNLTQVECPTIEVQEFKFINTSLNDAVNNTPIENRAITTNESSYSQKDMRLTDFNAVTARVDVKKMEVINEMLQSITADDISQLLDICFDPNLIQNNKKDFFLHEYFPYVALKALQQQNISASEFSTLATLHAVVLELMQENDNNEFPVVFHNLFNKDGSDNNNSWEKIEYSIENSDPNNNFINVPNYEMIYDMKRAMSNKRPIEAGFWIYKSDIKFKDNSNNISHRLNHFGASMFFYLDQDLTMLPSISMRQEFLNVFFKSNACHLNPVIGTTKVKDLRDGALIRSRDFGIPFPDLPLPKKADGMEVPRIVDFQHHDAYHTLRISLLENDDIEHYIGFADELKKLSIALSAKRNLIKKLALKKTALFKKFQDNIEDLSDKNKEQAMIKLQKEFYKIKNFIDCLNKNIKAINRFKFLLYDLEMPYHHKKTPYSFNPLDKSYHHPMNIVSHLARECTVGKNIDVSNFYAMVTGNKLTSYQNNFYSKDKDVSKNKKLLIDFHESNKKDRQQEWVAETDLKEKKELERSIKELDLGLQFLQPEKKYELTSLIDDNASI